MKKKYEKPKMKIVEMKKQGDLLCASSDNPYWVGCWEESENGYWN